MRAFGTMALALILVSLIGSPARGQSSASGLLSNRGVRQELKLSDEQSRKLDDLLRETRARQRDEMSKLAELAEDQRRGKVKELLDSTQAAFRKAVDGILDPEQVRRLEQIRLQQSSPHALVTARVREALKLTDEQESKIREITSDLDRSSRDILAADPHNRGGGSVALERLRREASGKAIAVLSDAQKTAWKGLVGEPYEVKKPQSPP